MDSSSLRILGLCIVAGLILHFFPTGEEVVEVECTLVLTELADVQEGLIPTYKTQVEIVSMSRAKLQSLCTLGNTKHLWWLPARNHCYLRNAHEGIWDTTIPFLFFRHNETARHLEISEFVSDQFGYSGGFTNPPKVDVKAIELKIK